MGQHNAGTVRLGSGCLRSSRCAATARQHSYGATARPQQYGMPHQVGIRRPRVLDAAVN
ncbi:hypothetical protein ACP70R_033071 [Stipagrostis hirtigluma subsp. patula]